MFGLCRPKHQGYTPKGTPGNLGPKWPTPVDLSVGDIQLQIAAKWLQIAQRSQWRAYRKLPSLFRMVPSLTPYDLPSPSSQNGGSICPQDTRMAISPQWIQFMFGSIGFSGSADRMALFLVTSNPRWWPASGHNLEKFRMVYISATATIRNLYYVIQIPRSISVGVC